jgi:serine/threonine protein kinase/Tfp pilus assembly protein PilF
MGEVYRAHDSRLGRDVAIKILPEALASSPERLARFEREARTVAGLNHPNIVTVYAIEEVGDVRFLAMELVEGRDLSTMIAPGGLSLAKILDLAIPLADAMVAAHERRVVHRDLKPANVMLTRDGRVKVLDFGLAKLMEIEPDVDLTRTASPLALSADGQVVGTAPYMAPEQIRGEVVDARADLFSFGILIYELATGQRPFSGKTYIDVGSAILHDHPRPLVSLRPDLTNDLGRIVDRCLEKNPRERFQTALDVANELRALKRTLERGPSTPVKPSSDQVASIAVLPFVNRSASPDDEYFSDGLADELLNVLSKIRGLRVAARTSAFQFKGQNHDAGIIGEKLHVTTLLEGSVRKAGDRVRVSVQLVKVDDGYQMWSESYDRTLDDIFAVQDDIAQSVVKELRRTLLGEEADSKASGEVKAEISKAAKGRARNPESYRLGLQARYLMEVFSKDNLARAVEYLKQALELDPEFALGWALLSRAYVNQSDAGWADRAAVCENARRAAERAVTLEPDLGEGYSALAWIQAGYDLDWRAAEISFQRAMELAPGDAGVLRRASTLFRTLGRIDQAVETGFRSVEMDPLSPNAYHSLGISLMAAARHVEAEKAFRKALELYPQRIVTHAYLATNYLEQGRLAEAAAEVDKEPEEYAHLWATSIVEWVRGNHPEADRALQDLISNHAEEAAYQIATVFATRGDADEAFAWLEQAYERRDGGLSELRISSRLRSLHGDPRWQTFLRKMGLADS